MSVAGGKIAGIKLFGDFLAVQPVDIIENGLMGCPCRADTLSSVLAQLPVADCLGTITGEELTELILSSN